MDVVVVGVAVVIVTVVVLGLNDAVFVIVVNVESI